MTRSRLSRSARRVVLVTGAAQRIGCTIPLAFARQGWDVALHDGRSRRDAVATAAEVTALGRRAPLLKQADLASEAAGLRRVPRVLRDLGRKDGLVNNAALFAYGDAAATNYASLSAHYLANTASPVLLARELARHVGDRGADTEPASVINLLDQKLFNPNPDFLAYTLSKSALHAAATLLAQALAPRVRVVGVAPGVTLPSHMQDDEAFARTHKMAPARPLQCCRRHRPCRDLSVPGARSHRYYAACRRRPASFTAGARL